jgi:glutamate-1-semialdehyde 2,1-aminomutase
MAAGLATLEVLREEAPYASLDEAGRRLFEGLEDAARAAGLSVTVNRVGSMGSLFFNPGPVVDFDSAAGSDSALFTTYFKAMLEQGIYLAPSPFEAAFVSTPLWNAPHERLRPRQGARNRLTCLKHLC